MEVMFSIAKTLRRWRPMYNQELDLMVEEVILELEARTNQPLRIGWDTYEGMFRLRIVGCSAFGPRLYLRGDTSK